MTVISTVPIRFRRPAGASASNRSPCAADQMICGNGTERTQHPVELFGEGWETEGLDPLRPLAEDAPTPSA
jgi:hypothetical protein